MDPVTREEQYLDAIATGDASGIPPVPYTREEIYLNAIATGDTSNLPDHPYTREEMYMEYIAKNGGGGGGGDITVEALNVTSNGTTTAPSGKAYSPVTVNVPNSYAAGDEGKVVSNGALVAQTAHAEVTQNGTVDTTLNNSVTVNVPSGGTIEDYATGAWPTGAISLNNTVTTVAEYAFCYNTTITSFSAPECTFLKWDVLRGCTGLTSISLPKVTAIGRGSTSSAEGQVLSGCTALQTIHLPELLTAHGNNNFNGLGKTNARVTIVLPKITSYGGQLFRGSQAEAIDLGPGFDNIPSYSFYMGTYKNIILRRTAGVVVAAAGNSIESIGASTKVWVPNALIDSYKAASNWSAKGDIFYAIEGSIYENAYADGTPIPTT